jgi:hypothetical protein
MGFPDRHKLAEILEANGGAVPPGADPVAAGSVAPPEAGAVPPREGPEGESVPPEPGAGAGIPPAGGMPPGEGAPVGVGQLMPENLTPEQQEQMQAELALAARRKMAGV